LAKDKIKLLGTWHAWSGRVRRGEMVRPDGTVAPVLLRAGEAADGKGSSKTLLKQDGRAVARIEGPQVLQLLHITRVSDRPLWVYIGFEGISLERVLQVLASRREQFPVGAALGVVRDVGRGLASGLATEPGPADDTAGPSQIVHAGTAPSDVLVDASGTVRLAGFGVRRPGSGDLEFVQGYAPPRSDTVEADGVYAIGVLIVHLLSGEAPANGGATPSRHESVIRRALIRLLARSGEAVPEEVVQLVRDTLAFDSTARPALGEVIERLSTLAQDFDGPDLVEWAGLEVADLIGLQASGYPSEEDARSQRYVDAGPIQSDESSFDPPPVRSMAERQKVSRKALDEDDSSQTLPRPATEGTPTGRLPTSETDVHEPGKSQGAESLLSVSLPLPERDGPAGSAGRVNIGALDGPGGDVVLDIGSEMPWIDDDEHRPTSVGWLAVVGALGGMLLASGVGWFTIEYMLGSSEIPAPIEEIIEAVPEAVIPVLPEPTPEPDPIPEPPPEPPVAPRTAPVPPAPTPAPPPPAPTGPPPENFPVTFRSADPGVTRLIVNCHRGRGSGVNSVHIPSAGRGPCRVTGVRASDQIVVSAVLTVERTFTCFAGGRRVCE